MVRKTNEPVITEKELECLASQHLSDFLKRYYPMIFIFPWTGDKHHNKNNQILIKPTNNIGDGAS
jgi:hypothetical protein